VDTPGAAGDGIQQPGVQASSLVTGQIHDDGDGSIDPIRDGRQMSTPAYLLEQGSADRGGGRADGPQVTS
jgi:hypothetical protein